MNRCPQGRPVRDRSRRPRPSLRWRRLAGKPQANEVILMAATQSTQCHSATLRRAAYRAAVALRAIRDEQVLMWNLSGTLTGCPWTGPGRWPGPRSLDGPRLTGRHLPSPDEPQAARRP